MLTLYHITTASNWLTIQHAGLLPRLGPRSQFAQDTESSLHFTNYDDIPYWLVLLYPDIWIHPSRISELVLLRVNLPLFDIQIQEYDLYSEYQYGTSVPASDIELVPWSKYPDLFDTCRQKHTEIFLNHLESLSTVCTSCTRCALYGKQDTNPYREELLRICSCVVNARSFLHPHLISENDMIQTLKEYADDGLYAFTDTFDNTNTRLYQALTDIYPEYVRNMNIEASQIEGLIQTMRTLREHIEAIVPPNVLQTNTGGFTTH